MNELAQVEQDIEHGHVSAGSLVQLFNVASEAEQQRDLEALTRACTVARRLAEALGNGLAATRSGYSTSATSCSAAFRPPKRRPRQAEKQRPVPLADANSRAAPFAAAPAASFASSGIARSGHARAT